MAVVTRYVNTASTAGGDGTTNGTAGATRAYASLDEWEAAEQVDLVTATDTHIVNCSGTVDAASGTYWNITGLTTDATYFITVNGDNTTGIWDATKYHITSNATGSNQYGLKTSQSYTVMNNMCIELTVGGAYTSQGALYGAAVYCDFIGCIVKGVLDATSTTVMGIRQNTTTAGAITNCLVYDFAAGTTGSGIDIISTGGDAAVYNNTIINCDVGLLTSYQDALAKNNVFQNCTTDESGTLAVGSDYNLTDAASGLTGANSVHSATLTFVGGVDYHLVVGDTSAIGAAVDLSADGTYAFSTDVDGDTRSSWDIGFDEYVAAGSATISASDATATRGQTNYQFTYSGGDATPATATLSDGTNTAAITITTYNANGVCTCTIPSTIAIRHIATATLTVTDAVSGTPTASVDFQPASGQTFTNLTSIAGTDADFTFGYAGATVASGKQVVYETPTLEDSLAIVVSADCSFTLGSPLTQNNTSDYYVIDADGTIGVTDTNTFLFSAGGAGGGDAMPSNGIIFFEMNEE